MKTYLVGVGGNNLGHIEIKVIPVSYTHLKLKEIGIQEVIGYESYQHKRIATSSRQYKTKEEKDSYVETDEKQLGPLFLFTSDCCVFYHF